MPFLGTLTMEMDSPLKERLIGAAVLVVIGVWLIPWILDGPESLPEPESQALRLPAEQESAPVRTQTIDLEQRRTASVRSVPLPPATPPTGAEPHAPDDAAAAAAADDAAADAAPDVAAADAAPAAAADAATAAAADDAAAESAVTDPPPIRAEALDSADELADAARAEPKPAPTAASAVEPLPSGEWVVQLGSFEEEANAQRLADRVATYGHKAQVSTYRASGRLTHRVRVGPQESRNQAEAIASSLSAHGFVAQVVTVD